MPRIVHFEIQASDPQTLIDFYTELLGWKFNNWGGGEYWLIDTGPEDQPGINGGLLPRSGQAPVAGQPMSGFVCTADVASLDDTLARAIAMGATVEFEKSPVTGIGWVAYIRDPDGNLMGLIESDEQAK